MIAKDPAEALLLRELRNERHLHNTSVIRGLSPHTAAYCINNKERVEVYQGRAVEAVGLRPVRTIKEAAWSKTRS